MSLRYFGLLILLCLGSHIQAGAAVCSGGGGSDTLPPREISEEKVASEATIMFWNVENLFDTTDDPETEDDEFTPRGQRHWTASRLRTKIHHLATAIVEAGKGDFPPLVALAEVENDSVLEQLSHRSALVRGKYSYLITQSADPRGIDVALLYRSAEFEPLHGQEHSIKMSAEERPTRDILHVVGIWKSHPQDTLDLVICHLPSRRGGAAKTEKRRHAAHLALRRLTDEIIAHRPHAQSLIMGDMNQEPDSPELMRDMRINRSTSLSSQRMEQATVSDTVLYNLMMALEENKHTGEKGYKSYKYKGKWQWLDQFIVNGALLPRIKEVGSLAPDWMLTEETQYLGHRPHRTYYGYRYTGGYSDHLPIVMKIEK